MSVKNYVWEFVSVMNSHCFDWNVLKCTCTYYYYYATYTVEWRLAQGRKTHKEKFAERIAHTSNFLTRTRYECIYYFVCVCGVLFCASGQSHYFFHATRH